MCHLWKYNIIINGDVRKNINISIRLNIMNLTLTNVMAGAIFHMSSFISLCQDQNWIISDVDLIPYYVYSCICEQHDKIKFNQMNYPADSLWITRGPSGVRGPQIGKYCPMVCIYWVLYSYVI